MFDPLTHIVKSLELTGGVFLEGAFTSPWAMKSQVTEEDCRPFMPVPKQVIAYHVVIEGEMLLLIDGREVLTTAGDVVILPSNVEHVLASDALITPVLGDDLLLPAGEQGLVRIQHGGGGASTRILCGFLASQTEPSILTKALPDVLVVSLDDVATLNWIEVSIAMAARELSAGRVASKSIMSRLSELLIIEALRAYLEARPKVSGWLAGMADQKIARSLVRIHEDLENPPSVVELANVAGMSRSAFVDRFSELIGVAPRRYILDQRIQTACLLLRETSLGLSDVSLRVGYEATEAFSRAFKRETGKTPIEYRAGQTN